jgi:hypothetical protein
VFYFAVPFVQYRPVQWFLKPLFFEVPQRDGGGSTGGPPLFIGRQWLYREIYDMLTSDSPTNRYRDSVASAWQDFQARHEKCFVAF